jgi:hypothetical protein
MLLHKIEPSFPINPPVDPFGVYYTAHDVKNLTVAFQNIDDRNVVQESLIATLTAGSGIKIGLIQDEPRFTVHFHAANHCGFEFGPIGVIKI